MEHGTGWPRLKNAEGQSTKAYRKTATLFVFAMSFDNR